MPSEISSFSSCCLSYRLNNLLAFFTCSMCSGDCDINVLYLLSLVKIFRADNLIIHTLLHKIIHTLNKKSLGREHDAYRKMWWINQHLHQELWQRECALLPFYIQEPLLEQLCLCEACGDHVQVAMAIMFCRLRMRTRRCFQGNWRVKKEDAFDFYVFARHPLRSSRTCHSCNSSVAVEWNERYMNLFLCLWNCQANDIQLRGLSSISLLLM